MLLELPFFKLKYFQTKLTTLGLSVSPSKWIANPIKNQTVNSKVKRIIKITEKKRVMFFMLYLPHICNIFLIKIN